MASLRYAALTTEISHPPTTANQAHTGMRPRMPTTRTAPRNATRLEVITTTTTAYRDFKTVIVLESE